MKTGEALELGSQNNYNNPVFFRSLFYKPLDWDKKSRKHDAI